MLSVCSFVEINGQMEPLTAQLMLDIEETTRQFNADGLRVIAVAYRDFEHKLDDFSIQDESKLVLIGYLTFLDPPKESARPALEQLAKYGVQVKVLTGDNEFVTQKICKELNLDLS